MKTPIAPQESLGFVEVEPSAVLTDVEMEAFGRINDALLGSRRDSVILDLSTVNMSLYSLEPETGLGTQNRAGDNFIKFSMPINQAWRGFHSFRAGRSRTEVYELTDMKRSSPGLVNDLYQGQIAGSVMVDGNDVDNFFRTTIWDAEEGNPSGLIVGAEAFCRFAELTQDREREAGLLDTISSQSFALWAMKQKTGLKLPNFPENRELINKWREHWLGRAVVDLSQAVEVEPDGVSFIFDGDTHYLTTNTVDMFNPSISTQRTLVEQAQQKVAIGGERAQAFVGSVARVAFGFDVPFTRISRPVDNVFTLNFVDLEEAAKAQDVPYYGKNDTEQALTARIADYVISRYASNLSGVQEYIGSPIKFHYDQRVPSLDSLAALLGRKKVELLQNTILSTASGDGRNGYGALRQRDKKRVLEYAKEVAIIDFAVTPSTPLPELPHLLPHRRSFLRRNR